MRLKVENIMHAFGGNRVLRGVSFSVARGEIVALIGPNGAGKSTCFNVLSGQLRPDGGRVLLDGDDISALGARQRWQKGIGRGFQVAATFRSLSVLDNAKAALLARHHASWRFLARASSMLNEPAKALLERVELATAFDRPSNTLAYGDLRRLELALAMANAPRLLLMDEPTAGTSRDDRWTVMRVLKDLVRESDTAVLLTEHDVDVVFQVADRVLVLDKGQLIADGHPDVIREDAAVRAAYLGDMQ